MSTLRIVENNNVLRVTGVAQAFVPNPFTPNGGEWVLNGDLIVNGDIIGGSSPFLIQSRQSTLSGAAFQLAAQLNITGKLLELINDLNGAAPVRWSVDGLGITYLGNLTDAQEPAAGVPGRLYWNTDQDVLRVDDGGAWSTVGGGGITDPITVNGWTPASGVATITGDLLNTSFLETAGIAAPALSPAGKSRLYFDSGLNQLLISEDAGAYVPVVSAGAGDVVGPGAGNSTDDALVRWNGATGALVADSNAILNDAGDLALVGSATLASVDATNNVAIESPALILQGSFDADTGGGLNVTDSPIVITSDPDITPPGGWQQHILKVDFGGVGNFTRFGTRGLQFNNGDYQFLGSAQVQVARFKQSSGHALILSDNTGAERLEFDAAVEDTSYSKMKALSAVGIKILPNIANSASAVGLIVDQLTSLTTTGAKIMSVRNAGAEKFSVDKDGELETLAGLTLDPTSTGLINGGTIDSGILTLTGYADTDAGAGIIATARKSTIQTVLEDTDLDGHYLKFTTGANFGTFYMTARGIFAGSTASGNFLTLGLRTGVDTFKTVISNSASGVFDIQVNDSGGSPRIRMSPDLGPTYENHAGFIQVTGVQGFAYVAGESDVASGVAHIFDNDTTLSTSGALLMSVRNNTVEKFSIDKDGETQFANGIIARQRGIKVGPAGDFQVQDSNGAVITRQITATNQVLHASAGGSTRMTFKPLESIGGQFFYDMEAAFGINYQAGIADSAAAIGHRFDTLNSLATSGSTIASFRTAGVEVLKIEGSGQQRLFNRSDGKQFLLFQVGPNPAIRAGDDTTAGEFLIDCVNVSTGGGKVLRLKAGGANDGVNFGGAVTIQGGPAGAGARTGGINLQARFTKVKSDFPDGSSADALIVETSTTWANASARLLSVRNLTTEKFSVDVDGGIHIDGDLDHDGTNVGFYGTAPVGQAAAYTRNAVVVEDRTLLASASATTVNNNNVLAALIADLKALGLIG